MAVYKVKRFNQPAINNGDGGDQPTAKELQMEQMKLQRQLIINQRARDKARQQERESKIRMQLQAQKIEQRKDNENDKKIIQSQKKVSNNIKMKNYQSSME